MEKPFKALANDRGKFFYWSDGENKLVKYPRVNRLARLSEVELYAIINEFDNISLSPGAVQIQSTTNRLFWEKLKNITIKAHGIVQHKDLIHGGKVGVILENLVSRYSSPCVLDLKVSKVNTESKDPKIIEHKKAK